MRSEPLELRHKEILADRFKALSPTISEYTFANQYLFREIHKTEVVFDFDLFIKGKTRDGFTFLMPTSPIESLNPIQLRGLIQGVDFLFPIPGSSLTIFDPAIYEISFNEDDSDYVYETQKFCTYPGRHLAGRRNLVKQFSAEHAGKSYALTKEKVGDALTVLENWQKNFSTVHGEEELSDYQACFEAIQLADILGLNGRVFYDNQTPVGLILGERLSQAMFVEHFAKAAVHDRGIYQYMYQEFALALDDSFYYVNMEQDLGDSGLKQSKRAYQPDKLIEKYRIKLKTSNHP